MTTRPLTLSLLDDTFAVCRLDADASLASWATTATWFSITRTSDELSIVCPQGAVPDGVRCEREWRCLRVSGVLDFSLVGILASLTVALAAAGISVFAVSTFDTDYLLVKEKDLAAALDALRRDGNMIA
jgi:hypothetical protein